MPAKTITVFLLFLVRTARRIATDTLTIPVEKANNIVSVVPRPRRIDVTAPTQAPEETPNM